MNELHLMRPLQVNLPYEPHKWKYSILYFYAVFVAYLCDGGVAFFMRGVFSPWRQLLALGLFFILFRFPKKYLGKSGRTFLLIASTFIVWFVFRACITFLFSNIGAMRIAYSFWGITIGIPFFILPTMYALRRGDPVSLFWKILLLGGFFGCGLLFDGISGGFFNFLKADVIAYSVDVDDLIRYSFLAQLLTSIGIVGSLFCALSLYLVSKAKTTVGQLIALGCGFVFLLGSWFTGSRQIFIPLLGVYLAGLPAYIFFAKGRKILLIPCLLVIVPLAAISGKNFLVEHSQDEIAERFTVENISEDSRTETWKQGCRDIFLNPKVLFWGNQFAYTGGGGTSDAGERGSHYENTFLAQINNTGIIQGLYVVFPIFFILKKMKDAGRKKTFFDFTMLLFLAVYILTSLVSPNGVGITALPALYFIAGIYNVRDYFVPPRVTRRAPVATSPFHQLSLSPERMR